MPYSANGQCVTRERGCLQVSCRGTSAYKGSLVSDSPRAAVEEGAFSPATALSAGTRRRCTSCVSHARDVLHTRLHSRLTGRTIMFSCYASATPWYVISHYLSLGSRVLILHVCRCGGTGRRGWTRPRSRPTLGGRFDPFLLGPRHSPKGAATTAPGHFGCAIKGSTQQFIRQRARMNWRANSWRCLPSRWVEGVDRVCFEACTKIRTSTEHSDRLVVLTLNLTVCKHFGP